MITLYLGAAGLVAFLAGAVVLGRDLRLNPTKENAERRSRTMHLLFFVGLGVPFMVSVVHPGLTHLDPLVGLAPLPARGPFFVAGVVLAIPGLYLLGASNRLLRALGSGANAFRLTQRVVGAAAYRYTRNPMSLGYYLSCLAIAFLTGSTLLTLYVVLGIIPVHLAFLQYFEEFELELRFGESYRDYRRRVPFLVPWRTPGG